MHEGEDCFLHVEKLLKKRKISLPMSQVFGEVKYLQALWDFHNLTAFTRINGVVEEAENSDHAESSDGGV
jgi:hypothetical protein